MTVSGMKNVCSKTRIETPEQTVRFDNTVKFIRTALEHIKVFNLELWKCIFKLGYSLKPYEFICKSNIYIFHIFF